MMRAPDQQDPTLLLAAAKSVHAAGEADKAAAHLRAALALRPPYVFHARAATLVSELWVLQPPALRAARIAVLGASTTALLVPVLRALSFRDGVNAEFYEGVYGAYRQEILDPQSGLHRFRPTVTFILPHWRSLALPPVIGDEEGAVEAIVAEQEALWNVLGRALGCHVVQHAFDLPAEESHGHVATGPGGRRRVIERVNLEMARRRPSFVSTLDQAAVQREVGRAAWQSDRLWFVARQHPAPEALPALAEMQMAHVRAVTGLTKKVVVCDLDNTLWGGVIGEDGLDGIRIGPGSPAGEAHARLQEYLLELKQRGVLLAACSKNEPVDARLPFERHPQMVLRLDDFAAFVSNWADKAQNIHSIARTLSLGTDSFVFLDDNPMERAWVRAQVPEVAVVELGPTVFSYVSDLDAPRYFFTLALTEEDRRRGEQYRGEAARQTLRETYDSLDAFLEQLRMRGRMAPVSDANIVRVTQLVNKTNQFNLTGTRLSQGEIEAIAGAPGSLASAFSLSDRFGDYGLISVLLCTPCEPRAWKVRTWVMSCRVLGRGMERFVAEHLIRAAREAGIERIVGIYRPTGRNDLVAGLYADLGFSFVSSGDGERRYELIVGESSQPGAHAIETDESQALPSGEPSLVGAES